MKYVNCKTEERANELLSKLTEYGYKWRDNKSLQDNKWNEYQEDTVYCIDEEIQRVEYCDINPEMNVNRDEMVLYNGSMFFIMQ